MLQSRSDNDCRYEQKTAAVGTAVSTFSEKVFLGSSTA